MPASHTHTAKEHHHPKSNSKHTAAPHEKPSHIKAVKKDAAIPLNSPQNQNEPDQNIAPPNQDKTDKTDTNKAEVKPIDGKQAIGEKADAASASSNPSQSTEKDNKLRNGIIAVLFVIAFAAIGYGDYEHVKYVAAAKDDALRAAATNSATSNSNSNSTDTSSQNSGGPPAQFMR
jgi:hypothetical protein